MRATQDSPLLRRRWLSRVIGAGIVTAVATPLFLLAHELGHAMGFWLSGFAPCIGVNNCWAAPPYQEVHTLLGGLLGPLVSLFLGLAFLAAHFTFRSAKMWTFAFSMTNFIAHAVFPFAFVFSLLLTGKAVGPFPEEAESALMLPATQSTIAALQHQLGGIDRFFLLRSQSLLVIWPLILLPALGVVLLWSKGRPSGPGRNVPLTLSIVVAALAGGRLATT